MGKLCGDCRSERFSVHNNEFKVLDAYSYVGLLLNSKIFKIEHVQRDRGVQWLLQDL